MDQITGLKTKIRAGGALQLACFVDITERNILELGPEGPIGNQIYGSGNVFADRELTQPIGSWTNYQVTVDADPATGIETRAIKLELAFSPRVAKKIARSHGRSKAEIKLWSEQVGVDEIVFQGFNDYPYGAGLPTSLKPIGFSGSGYGALAGIEAQASVILNNGSFVWNILFQPPGF